jgi:hypothetical protein
MGSSDRKCSAEAVLEFGRLETALIRLGEAWYSRIRQVVAWEGGEYFV